MTAITPTMTPAVPPRMTAGVAIAEWLKLTPRQRAIAIVCKHGTSYVGHRTDPATNTIHHAAARRLVRAGTHEYVTGSDGTFLREIPPADLVRLPARCLDQFDNLTAAIECRERRGRPSPNGYAALYTYAVIFGLDQQLRDHGTQSESGVLAEIRARLVAATAHDTGRNTGEGS